MKIALLRDSSTNYFFSIMISCPCSKIYAKWSNWLSVVTYKGLSMKYSSRNCRRGKGKTHENQTGTKFPYNALHSIPNILQALSFFECKKINSVDFCPQTLKGRIMFYGWSQIVSFWFLLLKSVVFIGCRGKMIVCFWGKSGWTR